MKPMELALALQRQVVVIDFLKQQDIPYSTDFNNWKTQTEALLKKAQEPDFLYLFQELCRTEKDSRAKAPRDRYLRYQVALIGSRALLNRLVEKLTSPIETERSPEEVYEELRRRLSQAHAFINTLNSKRSSIFFESSLVRVFSIWESSDPGSVSNKDIEELEQRFCALRDAVEGATGDKSLSASLGLIPADLSVARRERIERLIAMANELLEYIKSWVEDPQDTIENLKAQIEAMSKREARRIERLSSQRVDEVYDAADFLKAELEEDEISLREQLAIHQKNLNELEVRKARYGMNAPLAILNEIDYTKEQIAKKRERLEEIMRLH